MKVNLLRFLTFLVYLILFSSSIKADSVKRIGNPYVQNFPKSVYLSGNQNWSIAKDKAGIMYFGNAQGLLTYDGKYWRQYAMPNRQIVRAVATGNDGLIYTGSYGEFGYWSAKNKKLVYTSVSKLIPSNQPIKDEIWKIYTDGKRVIFQSFSTLYIYQDNKISIVKGSGSFLFLQRVGNRFFVEVTQNGLFELKGNQLVAVPNTSGIYPQQIMTILPYKNGQLLIGTSKGGLFLYNGTSFSSFQTPANEFLKTFQLNNGIRLNQQNYAFGTILNGIIIIDENGNIIQKINKSGGLQNNTILSLYVDQEENLWAGLDNGIDRVELNSSLYFYLDKAGQFGTVYSSIIYKNNIYLGTNQGLFYSQWSDSNRTQLSSLDFKLIPNSQGQVWELSMIDGQLICGHNEGTFKLNGAQMEKISPVNGGWTIKKLRSNPDYLIQGTYTGLVLYKKNKEGNWNFYSSIANFSAPSKLVEQDARGDIWVSHAYKGLYRLTLSEDYKKAVNVRHYDKKNGLPSDYNINVFQLDNTLIFSSDAGFMLYDQITDRFSPYTALNKELGSFASANKIINAGIKKYWLINHGKTALVNFMEAGKLVVDSNQFSLLDGRMVQYYENISQISKQMYLVSVDDGFVIYDDAINTKKQSKQILPSVLIRNVEDITDIHQTITEIGNVSETIAIPFSRNNIRISFALPYYRQAKIKFQYYLEGYSKQWSEWSSLTQKDFTNLNKGKYRFLVRAKINDSLVSKISVFEFTVRPAFYASIWAYIIYGLTATALLFIGKKHYDRKLKKDRENILHRLQDEKEVFLKKEAEATEKHIIKIKTEKLQAELQSKTRELANSAMSLVYKNELLQKLSQEMMKLKDKDGKKVADEQLRKVQKIIDEGMNDERDWSLFESSFNEAHGSFFKKLKANHPDLVPNDLKLCAYLHMNMSSKEMASLLNISLRGVEIRRYRLRKKLNIPHDKNLAEFFMEL